MHPTFPSTASHLARVKLASLVLAGILCLNALVYGLLPGLLAACLGYLCVSAVSGKGLPKGMAPSPAMAAGVVIALPVLALGVFAFNVKGMTLGAVTQYQALLHHLAGTVLEIRQKLPADLASHLPAEPLAAQTWLASYLKAQASALTNLGKAWLQGGLLVYVGLVVGALIGGTPALPTVAPLRHELRQRAKHFVDAFRQIMVAQFWIAAFNAACTSVFLLAVLPLFDTHIPYSGSLIALTFVAGLIPIAGNLLCNGVLALVGVSVSPMVGLACFGFLIAIHKFEYFINAKVVGRRTNTAAWELLAVMFAGEAIFGISGLVCAPLYYAYIKKELQELRLI